MQDSPHWWNDLSSSTGALFLLLRCTGVLGRRNNFDDFEQHFIFQTFFFGKIRQYSLGSIWKIHNCPVCIVPLDRYKKGREKQKQKRNTFNMETVAPTGNWTKQVISFVMSPLIFLQLLLLGSRVINSTTDTWRHCTGMVPFYRQFHLFAFYYLSTFQNIWCSVNGFSDEWFTVSSTNLGNPSS